MDNLFKVIAGVLFSLASILILSMILGSVVQWLWNDVMRYLGMPRLSLIHSIKLMVLVQLVTGGISSSSND